MTSSVIRSTSPMPIVSSINTLVPQLAENLVDDLLHLHSAYIQGDAPVSAEIGAFPYRRKVFVIPKKGTVLDLLEKPIKGADKVARKVLFIDSQGKPSLKMLSSAMRNKGGNFAKIALVSRLFPSLHILCLRHFQFAGRHYLLSPLKSSDAYSYFFYSRKSGDPVPALLDVFIGAFKGLVSLHAKNYVHTDLQNPRNILVEKRLGGRVTGVLADLDRVHFQEGDKGKQRDVLGLFISFATIINEMKRKNASSSLTSLHEKIEELLKQDLPAVEVIAALQELRQR